MESAKALLQKLKEGKLSDEFTIKQVYGSHWRNLTNSTQARTAVNILVDFGWLTAEEMQTAGAPRTLYKLTVPREEI